MKTQQQLIDFFDENEDEIHSVIPYPYPDDFKAVIAKFYLEKINQLMTNNYWRKMKPTYYKHHSGPNFPIHHFAGTEVYNPYHNPDEITERDAIEILVCRDPRRSSHIKNAHEGYTLRHRK